MKSRLAEPFVFRKGSSTRLVSRYEHNKQNIHVPSERAFGSKEPRGSNRQLLLFPRRLRQARATPSQQLSTQKLNGLTLEPITNRRNSKKPSMELPYIGNHAIHKNRSLQRNKVKKFYTEAQQEQTTKSISIKETELMSRQLKSILDFRHAPKYEQFSIDHEVAKLNALTKRCSVLRMDLVNVQTDLMTLNLTLHGLQ